MNGIVKWGILGVMALLSTGARADFPELVTRAVLPGCQVARTMDGSEASMAAASKMFAHDPGVAMSAGYCAAWASEAFDRYADQPECFTNDMSIDDLILVVINYAAKHPDYDSQPFISVAEGAVLDRWPDCVKREKQF